MQTLNIGLDCPTGTVLTVGRIATTLELFGYSIHRLSIVESDTEPTAVVDVTAQDGASDMHDVAMALTQEAIAVATGGDLIQGVLVGPGADNWGEFNPDFFFMHDGSRMGNVMSGVAA
jgi:hypothetical protein